MTNSYHKMGSCFTTEEMFSHVGFTLDLVFNTTAGIGIFEELLELDMFEDTHLAQFIDECLVNLDMHEGAFKTPSLSSYDYSSDGPHLLVRNPNGIYINMAIARFPAAPENDAELVSMAQRVAEVLNLVEAKIIEAEFAFAHPTDCKHFFHESLRHGRIPDRKDPLKGRKLVRKYNLAGECCTICLDNITTGYGANGVAASYMCNSCMSELAVRTADSDGSILCPASRSKCYIAPSIADDLRPSIARLSFALLREIYSYSRRDYYYEMTPRCLAQGF